MGIQQASDVVISRFERDFQSRVAILRESIMIQLSEKLCKLTTSTFVESQSG
jgi:hypothetical protein